MEDLEPIIPGPDDMFHWPTFHTQLDRALATYLEDGGSIHDTIINFADYSYGRRMLFDDLMDRDETEPRKEAE